MIELSELVRDLRTELATAMAAAPADGLHLALGPVEIEVTVGVDKSAGAGAKVKFWVLELGPEAAMAHSLQQRIKLTLTPQIANSSATPYVTGPERPSER